MTTTVEPIAPPSGAQRPRQVARYAAGVVALVLVVAAAWMPIWRAHLIAPQYPGGLHIYAYGHGMEGDIEEVDALNHYIGMRPFDPADVPEMALWPLGVVGAVLAVGVATLARRRWLVIGGRMYLWAFPLVILADIQVRLHQYGHDLDPGAALRIPEFTPWALGPTRVWNFTNVAYPGSGMLALLAAAALVSLSPWVVERIRRARLDHAATAAAAVLVALAVATPDAGAATLDASTLAARLAAASPGDTIVVDGGIHHGNLVIDVPVTLEGRNGPVIHGDGTGSTVLITAAGTTITGFRVSGSGVGPVDAPAGIRIVADDVTVEGTEVGDAYIGIAVVGADRVHLVDNVVTGRAGDRIVDEGHALSDDGHRHDDGSMPRRQRGDGISIWDADGVLVRGNTVGRTRDGIYISFGSRVLVDTNTVVDSRYAVHSMYARDLTIVENRFEGNLSGAVLMYGGPALILRNTITSNRSPSTGFGVILKDVDAVEAVENVVIDNRIGFQLEGPAHGEIATRVHRNTIARNQVGATLPASARGTFSANSFVDNLVQIGASGLGAGAHVEWAEHGWGNYWSGYQGVEIGDMGRGGTPHHEGSRVDGLLERSPVLVALASSPGMRLIRSVESHRFASDPVVVDPLPLVRPVSPPLPAPTHGGPPTLLFAGLGLALAGLTSGVRLLTPRPASRRYAA